MLSAHCTMHMYALCTLDAETPAEETHMLRGHRRPIDPADQEPGSGSALYSRTYSVVILSIIESLCHKGHLSCKCGYMDRT